VNAIIADLANTLSGFPNLGRLCIKDDILPSPEPWTVPFDGPFLLDAVHVGLLAVARANLPHKSFRILCALPTYHWVSNLHPSNLRSAPGPLWESHLIDLALVYDFAHDDLKRFVLPLAGFVVRTKSLRALHLRFFPCKLYRLLTAAIPAEIPNGESKLEILDFKSTQDTVPDVLIAFVLLFCHSPEHLYVQDIKLVSSGKDWATILSHWAQTLSKLRSLGFHHLRQYGEKLTFFDGVVSWDDPPEGKMEYTVVNYGVAGSNGVAGVKYQGGSRGCRAGFGKDGGH
jgi:hypothetical protein